MTDHDDPLAEQLRREAMAERPAFSSKLHDRILDRIRDEGFSIQPRRITSLRWLAAAAAIAIVAGISAAVMLRSRPVTAPIATVAASNSTSKTLTVDFQGLFFAQISSSGFTVRSPLGGGSILSTTEPPKAVATDAGPVPASPEWLFDQLQAPTSSAKIALAEVIPPQLRELAGWTNLQR